MNHGFLMLWGTGAGSGSGAGWLIQALHCVKLMCWRQVRKRSVSVSVLCPSSSCTVRRSTPFMTSRLANVWRGRASGKP